MEELIREYVIPIKPVEVIDCSYLPTKRVNHVRGQHPTQVRGKINIKSK